MQIMIMCYCENCSSSHFRLSFLWFWHHSWINQHFSEISCRLYLHVIRLAHKKIHLFEIYLLYLLPDDSNQMKSLRYVPIYPAQVSIIIYANFLPLNKRMNFLCYMWKFMKSGSRRRWKEKRCDIKDFIFSSFHSRNELKSDLNATAKNTFFAFHRKE